MRLYLFHKLVLVGLWSIVGVNIFSQKTPPTELSYESYIDYVVEYHPIAQSADLLLDAASAEMLYAKGNLDPEVTAYWDEKNLKDIQYYQQYQTMIRVPTILGIDVVGAYENANGDFLNPADEISNQGLWNLGLEANVLQGLIVNERRIAIDRAGELQNLAVSERQLMINDLIYNATSAYLDWQFYYQNSLVYEENLEIAQEYFEGTKETYFNGEKTAMDTLEAFIQRQDAESQLIKNKIYLVKSIQELENYLWFQKVPMELAEETVPQNYTKGLFSDISVVDEFSADIHPIIMAAQIKININQIEQRLKREKLKPKLKLKYNALLATSSTSLTSAYSTSDFKWGLDFSYPIFRRVARGEVKLGEVKIKESMLEMDNKRNELTNKINAYTLQSGIIADQLELLSTNLKNYESLLMGERELFRLGESSVFLLNKRQEKYIDGQLKLIEAYINRDANQLELLYWLGQLEDR